MLVPNVLQEQFKGVVDKKHRRLKETKEEKVERLKLERGLTHGKGKRKKKKKK